MPLSRRNSRGGSRAGSQVSCASVPRARSASAGWQDADGKNQTRPKTLVRGASAPGLDEPTKRRRAKRSGYNHPAAMQSAPDLLYMPPDEHFNSNRDDPVDSFTAAGVTSDRMVQLLRCCLEDSKKTAKLGYQPTTRSDPILHKQSEDEEQCNDPAVMRGAAGVRTDRLTFLNTNWISEKEGQDHTGNRCLRRTDIISHKQGGPPAAITKGIRRFEKSGSRSVALSHNNARLTQLPQDAVKDLVKTKEVKMGGGEVIYNVAGGEDMIPPATRPYMKSDRPASAAYRAENEKRLLPGFFRWRESQRWSPTLGESEDMYHVMYGDRAQHAMCKAQDIQVFAETPVAPTGASGCSGPPADRTLEGRKTARSASVDRLAGYAGFPTCREIEGRRTARSASSPSSGSPAKSYQRTPLTQREQRRHSDPSGRSKHASPADDYGKRARAF